MASTGDTSGSASNSAASGGVGSSRLKRKNATGARTDVAWEYGIDVDKNSRRVQCKFCKKIMGGGIYRFKHHLACTHKDTEPCLQVPDDVKAKIRSVMAKSIEILEKRRKINRGDDEDEDGQDTNEMRSLSTKSSAKNSQTTINNMFKKDLREDACQQIARFFYTSAIPFNCINNPEFAKAMELVAKHGPGFKPPSYHEVREKYLKQEVDNTVKLLEDYKAEWKKTGCSIMSDGWSDKKRRSICNFLVNSPKGTVFLSSVDTSDISKTACKIFEMLDAFVEKIGEENVVQVVTDNAANYKAAGELLMQKRRSLFWTPCAAHCIDLILEDFEKKLEIHQMTITRGRKITTYIYARTMLIAMVREFLKGGDLIRPGATRFATAYLTLGCLSENKLQLMNMFTSTQWRSCKHSTTMEGKRIQELVMDSEFWRNVTICLKAALPLVKVLRLVDSDEKPAMGFIYNAMDKAKEKIQVNFGNVKKWYEPIWNIVDERWALQLHRPLHAAGYYLNPQFHYAPDFKVDAQVKLGFYECLTRMVPDKDERCKIDLQIDSFKDAKGLFGIEAAKATRDKKHPAKWWDSYGDQCPELQKFAIRVLSLTCSSSGCERNWSAFDMVHTKKRNRLHQKKMNDLVFVMCNMKLKEKSTRNNSYGDFEDIQSDDEWISESTSHVGPSSKNLTKVLDLGDKEIESDEEETDDIDRDVDEFAFEVPLNMVCDVRPTSSTNDALGGGDLHNFDAYGRDIDDEDLHDAQVEYLY